MRLGAYLLGTDWPGGLRCAGCKLLMVDVDGRVFEPVYAERDLGIIAGESVSTPVCLSCGAEDIR